MKMFRTIKCGLLAAFLLFGTAAPLTFTACTNEHPEINVQMVSDYSGIIDVIKNLDKSLADKMALIENAIKEGTLSNTQALDAIKTVLNNMNGTMADKLAAIEAAVNSQTTSLETKLALIETALNEGFADVAEGQDLMKGAIESLEGTVADKLDAVKAAMDDQTTALKTKLQLLRVAVDEGFASVKEGQEMLVSALEALEGTVADKLDAVAEAIDDQTLELSDKLALIDATVEEGFANEAEALGLIEEAISNMAGDITDKLEALKAAVNNQTTKLETKLDAVKTAVADGFITEKEALGLISDALEAQNEILGDPEAGTVLDYLASINAALGGDEGITAYLASLNAAISGEEGLNAFLASINATLGTAFTGEEGIPALLAAIEEALDATDYSEALDNIADILEAILEAMGGVVPPDPTPMINGHEYVEMGGLRWAVENVGVTADEPAGLRFAWGETDTKAEFTAANYIFAEGPDHKPTKKYKEGNNDPHTLEAADDAGSLNWGKAWRMPTSEEWESLRNLENFTWVLADDGSGYTVTSVAEPTKSIFIPCASYWSSSLYIHNPGPPAPADKDRIAWGIVIDEDDTDMLMSYRYEGLYIRPVADVEE